MRIKRNELPTLCTFTIAEATKIRIMAELLLIFWAHVDGFWKTTHIVHWIQFLPIDLPKLKVSRPYVSTVSNKKHFKHKCNLKFKS